MPRGVYRRQPERLYRQDPRGGRRRAVLDEIGDMPAGLQTRLLRVLQENGHAARQPQRLSGRFRAGLRHAPRSARQVQAGAFREDLLYRIQEYSLRIPPLRERAQLEAFILQLWRELGGERRDIRLLPEALAMLARYPGPATCGSC